MKNKTRCWNKNKNVNEKNNDELLENVKHKFNQNF